MDDMMRQIAVNQGYVPAACELPGIMIMAMVNDGKDPCVGCDVERGGCGGRPRENENAKNFD